MDKTELTVLVQQQDISAVKVDGVSSAQSGQTGANDDDSLRHYDRFKWGIGRGKQMVERDKGLGGLRESGVLCFKYAWAVHPCTIRAWRTETEAQWECARMMAANEEPRLCKGRFLVIQCYSC